MSLSSPELLTAYETCQRKSFYSASWRPKRLSTLEIIRTTLTRCLTATEHREDATWGDMAGSTVLDLASAPGIDATDPYKTAMNLSCLCDLLVTVLRKEKETDRAWLGPGPAKHWIPACLLSPEGDFLRRIVLVSHWTDERHYAECRSWFTLGEMAHYKLPMQLVVLVIGLERFGRRASHWCRALRHPKVGGGQLLRFRRRVGNTTAGFHESWTEIWREDHEEISRETWLKAMLEDDVLSDVCFRVDLPALPLELANTYRDLARRKLEHIAGMVRKPQLQMSGCHWPVPCQFRDCCHWQPEREPASHLGFVQVGKP